jgi:hypothetical protein
MLRKILEFNFFKKIDLKMIDGHCLYGVFDWGLTKFTDKILEKLDIKRKPEQMGGIDAIALKALVIFLTGGIAGFTVAVPNLTGIQNSFPFSVPVCIAYIKDDDKGNQRVFVRRLISIGCWTSKANAVEKRYGSGGKEIGTVTD